MSHYGAESSTVTATTIAGGAGPADASGYYTASDAGGAHKDVVLSPLNAKRLEEARLYGWGTRSLDLGSIPTMHGGTLYQLRALLFAREQLTSLSIPALPEAEQVFADVNIPSLVNLTIHCRYAEYPDIAGAMQAFADNGNHRHITNLTLTEVTQLPTSLGRLNRNANMKNFLAQLERFEISGPTDAIPGQTGAQRHYLRFIAAMTGLRSLSYSGYVPGLPIFQVIRVLQYVHGKTVPAFMQHLSLTQTSLEGSTPREDAQFFRAITSMPAAIGSSPPLLDFALGIGIDAEQLAAFTSRDKFRLRSFNVTLTPSALQNLKMVTQAHSSTLEELRVTVLPAPVDQSGALWEAFTLAVRQVSELTAVYFHPMLSTPVDPGSATQLLASLPVATSIEIHAPGSVTSKDATDAYISLLSTAERTRSLQKLHATLCDGNISERVSISRNRAKEHVRDLVLGRRKQGDDVFKSVKLVVPKLAGRLWPVVFLLKPWAANIVIVSIVAIIVIGITVGAFAIAVQVVNNVKKSPAPGVPVPGGTGNGAGAPISGTGNGARPPGVGNGATTGIGNGATPPGVGNGALPPGVGNGETVDVPP